MSTQVLQKRKIKWIKPTNENGEWVGILKFTDSEDIVNIADKLNGYIDFGQINSGDEVEVEINKNEDNEDVVTFIKTEKIVSSNTKTGEEKVSNVKTVEVIYAKTKGILFAEDKDEKKWYTLEDAVFDFIKKSGIKKGDKVSFESQSRSKGNDLVTKISLADSAKKASNNDYSNQKPASQGASTSSYTSRRPETSDVQRSIEAQASVNAASACIAKLLAGSNVDPDIVKDAIAGLARHNFDLIQELKTK